LNPTAIGCALFIACFGLYAQKTAPSPVRPTTGLPTTTTPSSTTNPQSTNSTASSTLNTHPIYLSGKVVLEDGTPPPELVKIERICGGTPRFQAYTDAKGRFQFQVDSQVNTDMDASDPMNRTANSSSRAPRLDLAGCDLRAVLPGFRSGSVSLASHTSFDNPDVGVIVIHRVGSVEGTTISMSSLNAPKDAQKAYEKGRELLKKEKPAEAERSFQKAVDIYPRYATAWYQLGLLQAHERTDMAEASFQKSIEADPKFVSPYLSLTLLYERAHRWDKALSASDAVIKLNPADFPQAHFFKAAAQYNLQDPGAEKTVRKAIELDTRHEYPQAEKLLAVILAQKQDYPGATEHFSKYLEQLPNADDAAQIRSQIARFQKQSVASKQP
jgi:tetratricopeptide (TPR) repeat protein